MKIMRNVAIYKMDASFGTATAIAWEDGAIVAVGNEAELSEQFPGAEEIDGNGCTMLPGFIDPHIHFIHGLLYRGALDCSPEKAPTIEALKDLLRQSANSASKDQWVVGHGYDPLKFPGGKAPTRHDLDDACPDSPAVILHYSCHESIANSKALALAGIESQTPNPFAGEIIKDSEGNPTGQLVERAMTRVETLATKSLIANTEDWLMEKLPGAQEELFGFGLTRIAEPAVMPAYEVLYRKALKAGALKMPIVMYPSSAKGLLEAPWDRLEDEATGGGDDRLRVGPLKIFLDGSDRLAIVLKPIQFAGAILI